MHVDEYYDRFKWISYYEAKRLYTEKTEADRRREQNQQATIDELKRSCGAM